MINPTNETDAREVLEKEIKSLILANFNPGEGGGTWRLNATQASKEIADLFVESWKIGVQKAKERKSAQA